MYTCDYYAVKSEQNVGKEIVLSVAYVTLDAKPLSDGTRVMTAVTEFRQHDGGTIEIRGLQAAAERLVRQCGTDYQRTGSGRKETQIKGIYTKGDESKDQPAYFVAVDK